MRNDSVAQKKNPFLLMNNEKQIINLFNYVFIRTRIHWAGLGWRMAILCLCEYQKNEVGGGVTTRTVKDYFSPHCRK